MTPTPDGADLELTIDHEVQFALERQLRNTVEHFEADSAVGIIADAFARIARRPLDAPPPMTKAGDPWRYRRKLTEAGGSGLSIEPGGMMGRWSGVIRRS